MTYWYRGVPLGQQEVHTVLPFGTGLSWCKVYLILCSVSLAPS